MTGSLTASRPFSALDVSSREFWRLDPVEREKTFGRLRAEEPVSWQRPCTAR